MKKYLVISIILLTGFTVFSQEAATPGQQEKNAILYMREEEKLARDVYDSLFKKWDANPFGNIRRSEQVHMDRMKTLVTTYQLEDPVAKNNDKQGVFTSDVLQKYYHELVEQGSNSLTEALKAGAKIEELDIADLETRIKQTQRQDIIATYSYLKMASENHLRAFVRRLKMLGLTYEPVILGKPEFDKIITSESYRPGRGNGPGRN